MSNAMQDLINAKKKDIQSKKASTMQTFKPPMGKSVIRVLPGWRIDADGNRDPQYWHDFAMHWIRTKKGAKPDAVYVCADKTFGEPCDVCQSIGKAIRGSSDDDIISLLKEANSSQKYLMNVLHRNSSDKKDEVQVMEVGITIFESIMEIICEYGDITRIDEGMDLVIKREGSGFDTKYTVMPSPKSLPVNESVLDQLHDLDAVVAQENETKKQAALQSLGTIVGILPPPSESKESASIASSLADEEAEDAVFAESEPEESASVADTSVDDDDVDWDALLEEDEDLSKAS